MAMRTRKRRARGDQAANAQAMAERFNREFPVGTHVWYWQSLPFGPVVETFVRSEAFVSHGGDPVAFLHGVSGYVHTEHVQAIDEPRRAAVQPRVLTPQGA